MEKSKARKKIDNQNFHKCMRFVILTAQLCGMMPVHGVYGRDYCSVRFIWLSWKVLHCCLISLAIFIIVFQYFLILLYRGIDYHALQGMAYFAQCVLSYVLFFQLAMNWPSLVTHWSIVESSMKSYGKHPNLSIKIKLATIIILAISLGEHIMLITAKLVETFDSNNYREWFKRYSIHFYTALLSFLEYTTVTAIFLQVTISICAFIWPFMDIFIIVTSVALSEKFKLITTKVYSLSKSKIRNPATWKDVRDNYDRLCHLCVDLNDKLSNLILFSFMNNTFFIVTQLYQSLKPRSGIFEQVYFVYSFGFLVGRTVSVILFGAQINNEGNKPLRTLNNISSDIYNQEINRFIHQITFYPVSLTGKHFFRITRGVILNLAGSLVTYVLILIQFNYVQFTPNTNAILSTYGNVSLGPQH